MRNSEKAHAGAKERKPVFHPGLVAVFGLLAALFFFTAAYGMIDHSFGFYLRQGNWTVAGIVWLAMVLGVTSILTAGFLTLMPAAMSRLLALVLALLVWCNRAGRAFVRVSLPGDVLCDVPDVVTRRDRKQGPDTRHVGGNFRRLLVLSPVFYRKGMVEYETHLHRNPGRTVQKLLRAGR